jgi:dTDP-4-dehydrorhamnose reductase
LHLKIVLLGKSGQLGWELRRALAPLGEITSLDYPQIDLTRPDEACQVVRQACPQVIVNATAYTAVDQAEQQPDLAMAINARAPGLLAQEAASLGAAFVHYSTDYIFDGAKGSDYLETDSPNPLGVYGLSKLEGERRVQAAGGSFLILRTSWVYSLRRESFVTKTLKWARQQPVLRMVTDQVGNPTWARMLAEVTAQLLGRAGLDAPAWVGERRGLYHLAGSGRASRYEWAQAVLENDPCRLEHIVRQVEPALTSEFHSPARRPLHSALNCDLFTATFGLRLPDWRDALRMAMDLEC